ncbi:MAG: GNAT family N-acetyltransferase [Hyphomonadaceae bacterium]|nr:GNAT family N-acetyltransferase [Hyphomonadaceae bacterium]
MRHVREIETDRLKLRRLCVADGARISQWTSDPAVARMTCRIPLPHPVVAAEGFVLITRARRDHVFAVDLRDEGLIGVIGAHPTATGAHEIGYWFGRPFWGQGYASEALSAFLSEAEDLGALEAGHFVDNPASGRVLEKAGFAYTGEQALKFSMARGQSAPSRRMLRPAVRRLDEARRAAHAG